jgi:hypothetical protein
MWYLLSASAYALLGMRCAHPGAGIQLFMKGPAPIRRRQGGARFEPRRRDHRRCAVNGESPAASQGASSEAGAEAEAGEGAGFVPYHAEDAA